ncbi:MAG TPA: carboxypeptidase-like regulatory domain-containing protein [Candidatus Eisenbacteria bacterium]|nr:carboxypeptidase-like regulatory domain-containing protein [Candidatus Eisenbacteria bacterium]
MASFTLERFAVYRSITQLLRMYVAVLILFAFGLSDRIQAQGDNPPEIQPGSVIGTVSNVNGESVANANVVLENSNGNGRRTVVTNENGFFEFHDVTPGTSFYITASAEGLAEWKSPSITITPSQFKILTDIRLRVPTVSTTVEVTQTSEEIATEQVKIQEKQRIFGLIPNFNVVYNSNPEPLTTRLKFRLALRTAIDPVAFLGSGFLAGLQQAADTPDYGQGAQGFAKRFGANTADAFTNIMIGGAILPSLLHQDPRYFYQGTGTTESRIRHAVLYPFVCKGDNGSWQPNFSSLGGDLASSAISNVYYPESNRGAGMVFTNFAISTGARMGASLAQEFVLRKLTRRRGDTQ